MSDGTAYRTPEDVEAALRYVAANAPASRRSLYLEAADVIGALVAQLEEAAQ